MNSTNSELFAEKTFDWNKYLIERNAEKVPEDFFHHVSKSELNGIEVGSVVEIENEDQSGYWFASVCSSKSVLIKLHYFGDENDKHDFWLEVKSSRIHSLNWGSDNNKKLLPPYPDRFSRVNPKTIKEKVEDCEIIVSNSVIQLKGAPIYNVFKPEMFIEVQDIEYPYRVWISKILKNVGGRLLLKMQGVLCPEKKSFWLFYLNERIFPLGWAERKGLPWRVMNLDAKFEDNLESNFLLNVLKPKTPEQHCYKVGEMLEVINPYSLMVFYVATIVKIYDNRYFKVEVDNDNNIEKRITFVANKENPYLFNGGWASKHKFLLKPPSDWKSKNTFSWSKYISMKGSKLANVDNACRKKVDRIHVGMKLEAVDPIETDRIRVATVKGFTDHWMILSFDRTQWCCELLHVRSVYSDDVFPVGWCNKHKYSLTTPKLPFNDSDEYDTMYYASDIDIDFNQSDNDYLEKYPNFVKGEIFYHYSKKNDNRFEDELEESIQNILNEDCVNAIISKSANEKLNNVKPVKNIRVEPRELDEEVHDEISLEDNIEEEICIYFNKNCNSGRQVLKKNCLKLPKVIGPGPVSKILKHGITLLINCNNRPGTALKKIKNVQKLLFNGPGGVNMLVISKANKSCAENSGHLLFPVSKDKAQLFCNNVCLVSDMCKNFMATEQIECHLCKVKEKQSSKSKFKNKETVSTNMRATRTKTTKPSVLINSDCSEKHLTSNKKIVKVGSKSKSKIQSMSLKKKDKGSVHINSDCSENNLTKEINPVGSFEAMPSSLKVTRKRVKPSIFKNADCSEKELSTIEIIKEFKTKGKSQKVGRKRAKSSTFKNADCSEKKLSIIEKVNEFETKVRSQEVASKRAKSSTFKNVNCSEKKLSTIEIIKEFDTEVRRQKAVRKIAKPSDSINSDSSQNNIILSEEIPQVGTKTNLKIENKETGSNNIKVIGAKSSILLKSDSSENSSTLNDKMDQFETKPRNMGVSRKRAKPAASINYDCSEDHSTLNEEISKVFEAKPSSMKAAKKRFKPSVSIDSACFENRITLEEEFNKEFAKSKIVTQEFKAMNMEDSRNMEMATIYIDSDSSENNFTLNEETNQFEANANSLEVARNTRGMAKSMASIDSDSSENRLTLNKEFNKESVDTQELERMNMEIGRNMEIVTISIDSDSSKNNFTQNEENYQFETKQCSMEVPRIKTESTVSIDSDCSENNLTYYIKTNQYELNPMNMEDSRNMEMATIYIDSDSSENNFTLNEETNQFEANANSLEVARNTRGMAKSMASIDSDSSENRLTLNKEFNKESVDTQELERMNMEIGRNMEIVTISIDSDSSKNNFTQNEENYQFETKQCSMEVPRIKTESTVSIDSDCSENNLTYYIKTNQYELNPMNMEDSRNMEMATIYIDSDSSENNFTLNEETNQFEANANSLEVARNTRGMAKSMASIDSDSSENRLTLNKEFNKESVDTQELERMNMEIGRNMEVVTIYIDSDSSENNITLIEESSKCDAEESSFNIAKETREWKKSMYSVDSDCSENNFTLNDKNKQFETELWSMKFARKRPESIVSIDSDCSENDYTYNEETNRYDAKPSNLNVTRKTRERSTSLSFIDSDSFKKCSTLKEFNSESAKSKIVTQEFKPMNMEDSRNMTMATISIDSDSSENNFPRIEDIEEYDAKAYSLNVARKTKERAKSMSFDPESFKKWSTLKKEFNRKSAKSKIVTQEFKPMNMEDSRNMTMATISIDSDSSENNFPRIEDIEEYDAKAYSLNVARKTKERAKSMSFDPESFKKWSTLKKEFNRKSAKSKIVTQEFKPMNMEDSRNMTMATISIDSDSSENNFPHIEDIEEYDAKAYSLNVARKTKERAKSMSFDPESFKKWSTLKKEFNRKSAKSKIVTQEFKPMNMEDSRNMTMATISIDSDSSENNFPHIEDIEEYDAKAYSLNVARKTKERAKSMSFDPESFKKWSTLKKEFNRKSAKSKIDTQEFKPMNMEDSRNMTMATISIDSDSSENNFTYNEETNQFDANASSLEVARKTRKIAKSKKIAFVDLDSSKNNFTINEENNILETDPWSMNVARKRTKSIISIDSDCSENNLSINEETNEFEPKKSSLKVARKRAKSTIPIESDSSVDSQFNLSGGLIKSFESKPSKIKFDGTRPLSYAAYYYTDRSERSSAQDEEITQCESESFIDTETNNMHRNIMDLKNHQSRPASKHEIFNVALAVLDLSNVPLVKRFCYYMSCIDNFESHLTKLNKNFTELEISIISEIESIKSNLSMMDEIDTYSNTKSDIDRTDQEIIIYDEWRLTYENYYCQDPRFKNYKVDIGHFETIRVTSNPKYWSPEDVRKYLSNDMNCLQIASKLYLEEFDGVAFMLLNEEQLLKHLQCKINLAIRIMCHVAEVKYTCLKKYCNI